MNKTTLITGASSGIGLEFAKIFAEKEYSLVLVARSEDKLIEIKQDLENKFKIRVKVITKDLSLRNSASEIYEELKKENIEINILINNAGFGEYGKFSDTDWEKELQMINLNIISLTNLTKLFLKDFIAKNSGKILNLGSVASFLPGPYMSVYYATKAYVLSFSEALSQELQNTNVQVTCLCPGATESGFQKASSVNHVRAFVKNIPNSKEVAEYGYRILMQNKTIGIHGIKNKVMIFLTRLTPRFLIRKIVAKVMKS